MMDHPYRGITNWLGLILLVLVLLFYFGYPVAMAFAAVAPQKMYPVSNPEGSTPIQLETEDGIQLTGWYVPPQNGVALIMIHGEGGSVYDIEPYAEMVEKHGYGVLALNLRGHGGSQGKINRLGWEGTKDVGAAVTFLAGRPEVEHIAGFGLSLGGEVLLGAASTYPEIEAICADGASRRSLDELMALESERSLMRSLSSRITYALVERLSGEKPPPPMLDSMLESANTRFLFIAAGNNRLEVQFNKLFKDSLDGRADLDVFIGVEHGDAFYSHPQEYEEVVIKFFSPLIQ